MSSHATHTATVDDQVGVWFERTTGSPNRRIRFTDSVRRVRRREWTVRPCLGPSRHGGLTLLGYAPGFAMADASRRRPTSLVNVHEADQRRREQEVPCRKISGRWIDFGARSAVVVFEWLSARDGKAARGDG